MKLNCFRYIIICLLCICSLTSAAVAQRIQVSASLDSTYVVIGMPTKIHLEATIPQGTSLEFPRFEGMGIPVYDDTLSFVLEITNAPAIDTVEVNNDMLTLRQDLEVFAFDSATLYIPPFAFLNGEDSVLTNSLALKVYVPFETVEVDPEKYVDIKNVIEPDFVIWDYSSWLIILLVVIALIILILWLFRYYKSRLQQSPTLVVKPTVPPHLVALEALEALSAKQLWQHGHEKQYFTELTDILRQYVEGRFSVPAMEQTTDEILDSLYELTESQKSSLVALRQILELADLVKFAKYKTLPDENQLSFMNAKMFVTQTKSEPTSEQTDGQTAMASEEEPLNEIEK